MPEPELEKLKFPIGKFVFNPNADENEIRQWVSEIENLPLQIRSAVKGLNEAQLNTPYRPGGWTVKQVVHHLADSHMNAYVRIKLALTENNPAIKAYSEKLWAEMDDAKNLPVESSLSLIEALHARWAYLLKNLSSVDISKTMIHPERGEISVKFILALYAWHGKHHCRHIISLRERMKW